MRQGFVLGGVFPSRWREREMDENQMDENLHFELSLVIF